MTVKLIFVLCMSAVVALGEPLSPKHLTHTHILKKLQDFQPNEKTRKMVLKKRKSAKRGAYISTRVVKEGFLRLSPTEWIYMVTVPTKKHTHDAEGLTLAIDQNGTIYENRAHVCGGVVHFSAKKPPKDGSSFFSTFIDSDNEKKWIRYEHGNPSHKADTDRE